MDDRQVRHDHLRDLLTGFGFTGVVSAYTVPEALQAMKKNAFDVIFLDHDLGTPENVSDMSSTILWAPEGEYHMPRIVWVHSSNPSGSDNIASKWVSAGIPTHVMSYENMLTLPVDLVKEMIA